MAIPSYLQPLYDLKKSDLVYPHKKLVDIRSEHGDLVQTSKHTWAALGYDTCVEILKSSDFLAMSPVEDGVNMALDGKNKLLQLFARPVLRVILNRHKFLSMVKLWMLMQDPPTHTRLRKISQVAFTPASIRNLTPRIAKVCSDLLDELEAKGKNDVDIINDFALPLPIAVIAAILGVPKEGEERFNQWSESILKGFEPNPEGDAVKEAMQAQDEIKDYFSTLLHEREQTPEDDVLSLMVQARDSGEDMFMTDDEIVANVVLLIIAGHETTVNLIGNTLHTFLTHPEQYNMVQKNHELLDNAIEESLRFDTPIVVIDRVANRDMEFAGKQLSQGDKVSVMLYAANLDDRQFEDPLKFDINRENSKRNISFGQGIHFCLGAPLARAEAKIAFTEIMKRFPNMKLVNNQTPRYPNMALNGFEELWVTLK